MKRIISVLLMCVLSLSLFSCGPAKDPNAEEYANYISGLLNAIYLQDYKAYTEMTGESAEQAAVLYENSVQNTVDILKDHFLIDTSDEEIRSSLAGIVRQLYQKFSYEVVSADYSEDLKGYVVTINVTPVNFMANANAAYGPYVDDQNMRMLNKEFAALSEYEYNKLFAQGVVGLLQTAINSATSLEKVPVQLVLVADANGTVSVSDDDLNRISHKFIGN